MKKLLFLTGNLFPCIAGDSIFSAGIVDILSELYSIDVLTFGEKEKIEKDENYLRIKDKLSSIRIVKYSTTLKHDYLLYFKYGNRIHMDTKHMQDQFQYLLNSNNYDYIIIDHLRMYSIFKSAEYLINRNQTKIILLAHNVEYKNLIENIKYVNNCKEKLKMGIFNFNLKSYEKKAIKNVDYLWGLCQEDVLELKALSNENNKVSSIIRPYFAFPQIKNEEELLQPTFNLLFLGSMSWYPNVQGVQYFIENIFNKLLELDNRYKLYIVGANPDYRIRQYNSDRIIVTGSVKSVDEYIKKSDLVIVPNKLGSGVKIKVLESIVKGIPVILFKESMVGYPNELFAGGFCVEDDNEFIKNIIELNSVPNRKVSFIKNARKVLLHKPDIYID